ncbi:unnamed protein product, partial [Ilex paraguariensis]
DLEYVDFVKVGCFSDFSATGILPLAGRMLLHQDQAQRLNARRRRFCLEINSEVGADLWRGIAHQNLLLHSRMMSAVQKEGVEMLKIWTIAIATVSCHREEEISIAGGVAGSGFGCFLKWFFAL